MALGPPGFRGACTDRVALDRLKAGLPGDWKRVGEGVYELQIDYGPSYRVYYAQDGEALILLL